VLTTGLSGSSVFTALLAQSGYWTGEGTVIKDNSTGKYNTYENSRLVEMNQQLLHQVGETTGNDFWYRQDVREKFTQLATPQLESEIKSFIEECGAHTPWIWKDPVLWQSLGFWLKYLDTSKLKIFVLYRRSFPLWVSQTSKRIIYDYGDLKKRETNSRIELKAFLSQLGLDFQEIEYDSLASSPKTEIRKLNEYLNRQLTMEDWIRVYRAPMGSAGKVRRNILALLIYLKNYSQRIRLP
jgi:hypothetical protein